MSCNDDENKANEGASLEPFSPEGREGKFMRYAGDPELTSAYDALLPYQGIQSFLRLPLQRDLDNVDIAVYGVPLDLATTNRPGARLGPRAIREQSLLLGGFSDPFPPHKRNLRNTMKMVDYGDLAFAPGYIDEMLKVAAMHIGRMVDNNTSTLGLGGDHLIAYPAIKEHARKHGPLSLIQFDAHSDDSSIGSLNHGSMFWHACEEGLIDPTRSIQVGLRHTLPEHDFNVIHGHEVIDMKGTEIAERIREVVGDHPCYVSLDVDGMDPAFAPGTGTPVPGGMTSMQQRQALWGLKGLNVVGADVVEVAPPYDPTGQTANLAAGCAIDLMHVLAEARDMREKS
ncbi:MAG: agmatinase [Pseudomonadales bacterium]